jgi:hypothetical protein
VSSSDRRLAPTIEAHAAAFRKCRTTTPWSLVPGIEGEPVGPGDSALILRVVAGLVPKSLIWWPTIAEAEWIVRLNRAVPDLIDQPDGWSELFRFAGIYAGREEGKKSTQDLDAYFALAPWRDGGKAYVAAIASGRLMTVHGGPFTPLEAFDALHDRVAARSGQRAIPLAEQIGQLKTTKS